MADKKSDGDRSARRYLKRHRRGRSDRQEDRTVIFHIPYKISRKEHWKRVYLQLLANHQTHHGSPEKLAAEWLDWAIMNRPEAKKVFGHDFIVSLQVETRLAAHKAARKRTQRIVSETCEVVNEYLKVGDGEAANIEFQNACIALKYEQDEFRSFRDDALNRLQKEFPKLWKRFEEEVEDHPRLTVAAHNRHIPRKRRD